MSLPKVLIIGQPFNNNTGGGITQSNLFGSWDKDKIAVACTDHMFNNLNIKICDTYYILGKEEYKWAFPFNFIQRKVESGLTKPEQDNSAQNPTLLNSKIAFRRKIVNNYFYPFLEYAGLFHSMAKITLSEKFCNWVNEYNPDVIYAQASTRDAILFCTQIQNYFKKPMVFHMMDDWPSTISEKGPFKNFWRKKIDKDFRELLNKATVLLSISDYMAQEYENRYGKKFITFHNPIDLNFWKSYQRKTYKINNSPTLLYAGRIGVGIQESLEIIAKAIEYLNIANDAIDLQYVLQTETAPAWIENYKCAKHKSLVPYKELPRVFAEADFLILPYDFTDESISFIKYSMPTKAPEYMISGTPVIVFAPEVTAIVKDAQINKWSKLVVENDIKALAQSLKKLVTSEDERRSIAQTAVTVAETKYNSEFVRDKFKNVINSLVK